MRAEYGFTLIEVLVSVAILALALGAVITAGSRYVDNTVYLREKTLATWIAHNVIVEATLQQRFPDKGKEEDEVEFANRKWTWVAETQETPDPDLRRMDVSIWLAEADEDEDGAIVTISAFVPRP
ncbi:MAG: type II secretion system minor pseudopilin GspI [Nevskiales bacterium]